MDPDVLLGKRRSRVDDWLEWSNGLALYRQHEREAEEDRVQRELERIGGR